MGETAKNAESFRGGSVAGTKPACAVFDEKTITSVFVIAQALRASDQQLIVIHLINLELYLSVQGCEKELSSNRFQEEVA